MPELTKSQKLGIIIPLASVAGLALLCTVFHDQLFEFMWWANTKNDIIFESWKAKNIHPLHPGIYEATDDKGNVFHLELTASNKEEWRANVHTVTIDTCIERYKEYNYVKFSFAINGQPIELLDIQDHKIGRSDRWKYVSVYESDVWSFTPNKKFKTYTVILDHAEGGYDPAYKDSIPLTMFQINV